MPQNSLNSIEIKLIDKGANTLTFMIIESGHGGTFSVSAKGCSHYFHMHRNYKLKLYGFILENGFPQYDFRISDINSILLSEVKFIVVGKKDSDVKPPTF